MDTIGERLKTWRKNNNLTIQQIYKDTGISTGGLSAYERDEKQIGSGILLSLWRKYDIDIAWILTGKRDSDLSPEEQEIVKCYRESNDQGKRVIMTVAQSQKQERELSVSKIG